MGISMVTGFQSSLQIGAYQILFFPLSALNNLEVCSQLFWVQEILPCSKSKGTQPTLHCLPKPVPTACRVKKITQGNRKSPGHTISKHQETQM